MIIESVWQVLQFIGVHVVIEIPVNLLSFWFTPVGLFFGIPNAKMISQQDQKCFNSADRQKFVTP